MSTPTPDSAEAVNVRIAELCGMDFLRYRYWYNGHDNKKPWHTGFKTRDEAETRRSMDIKWGCGEVESYMDHSRVPNYSGSLDAMHEAEKTLTGYQREDYWDEVAKLIPETKGMFGILHATAAQRAAAFLTTKTRTHL